MTKRLFVDEVALLCRTCAGLVYPSQKLNADQRRLARIEKIRDRLALTPSFRPAKPPQMHWSTFERLLLELRMLEAQSLARQGAFAEAYARRIRRHLAGLGPELDADLDAFVEAGAELARVESERYEHLQAVRRQREASPTDER